jgi:hypothetical protein
MKLSPCGATAVNNITLKYRIYIHSTAIKGNKGKVIPVQAVEALRVAGC